MKITKIQAYQVDLPLKNMGFTMSSGIHSKLDSTVVEIQTDAGITGYGEVCPTGSTYLPAYPAGVRAGLKELAPQLLGEDPLELDCLNNRMDYLFRGHPYVKSPIDMACWDILGKFTKLPIYTLMGGRFVESFDLYTSIPNAPIEEMIETTLKDKEIGYTQFQLKLSGKPLADIKLLQQIRAVLDPTDILIGDTNTGWIPVEAIQVANAIKDLDIYLEQPCLTYEECLTVRRRTSCPLILDECVTDVPLVVRAHADNAADCYTLKIAKQGGMTRTKQIRDLCVLLGMAIRLEDTMAGDISMTAVGHLAHSTPEKNLLSCHQVNSYVKQPIANGVPEPVNGKMQVSNKPGLGIEPIMSVLGDHVLSI